MPRIVLLLAALVFALPSWAENKVQVQWLGQSAFKFISPTGKVIVTDPWLTTNPKTPPAFKTLESLGKVDLVLVTHGHNDHMADAPALSRMNDAPLIAPAGLAQTLVALEMAPKAQRINKSGSLTPIGAGIRVTLVHAEHSSEVLWKNPASGKDEVHVGGEPGGFIIEFENGFRVWHLGDTGVFGDMKLIAQMYRPDLVLMPIGGGPFVMNPEDAAMVTRDMIKPKTVIPMHYGTNPQLSGTPEAFMQALGKTRTQVRVLQPGDQTEF
ncbi:metal-dependent hydrolase [Roseateles sp. SL47]|uniref:metal-dependent hydrolase n=1 Tax=Roseateles sp. SL47 TaxID=2995138 RepID=UPI002271386D|nr:metal-dependent hydrolase [Roseateles sp. SL47]WAC75647.1 metal-dependent hydrolase [Roseateles sp. SL47]